MEYDHKVEDIYYLNKDQISRLYKQAQSQLVAELYFENSDKKHYSIITKNIENFLRAFIARNTNVLNECNESQTQNKRTEKER